MTTRRHLFPSLGLRKLPRLGATDKILGLVFYFNIIIGQRQQFLRPGCTKPRGDFATYQHPA